MSDTVTDIFTEPEEIDPDTLANLGPLRPLAGSWEGAKGLDVNPKAAGPDRAQFIERLDLQPIDPQANGPQVFYGLRYHAHILKVGEAATYHDQVGYWLWEPATGLILQTLTIPRGQIALAKGFAAPDATTFKVSARRGETENGICSTVFLERAFRTESYEIEVTCHPDGAWSYFEDTVLIVQGQAEPFHHQDSNTLTKVAEPRPNPLAAALALA
ncbi:MAG TPA: heme-binding beta-barrel domain-containing protein [Caulobacteraceae bacterium]|nr:heme-binding beta-barrel domain-containing protein [Caulobacteraceae bacterium]